MIENTEQSRGPFPIPDILYKYVPAELGIQILENRQIRCTPHSEFDDLLDSFHLEEARDFNELNVPGSLHYFMEVEGWPALNPAPLDAARARFRSWVEESIRRYPGHWVSGVTPIAPPVDAASRSELARGFHDGLKLEPHDPLLLSLSESPIERLMWERYADASRGICIGFASSAKFLNQGGPGLRAREIIYSAEPSSGPYEVEMWRKWLVKHPDYAYEKEWRVQFLEEQTIPLNLSNGRTIRVAKFDPSDVRHILVGARAEDATKQAIADITDIGAKVSEVAAGYKAFTAK